MEEPEYPLIVKEMKMKKTNKELQMTRKELLVKRR